MNDQPSQQDIAAIEEALASGRKIEAIKIYRAATGAGLKEAKDYVEALNPKLAGHDPERGAKRSESKGCASLLILGAGLTAASILWMLK